MILRKHVTYTKLFNFAVSVFMLAPLHAKSLCVLCFFESVRCAMAVNVTVTPEQAALLLAIL